MKKYSAYKFRILCTTLFLPFILSLLFFDLARARPPGEMTKQGTYLPEKQEWTEVEKKLQEAEKKIEEERRKLSKGKSKSKPKKKKKRKSSLYSISE